jgi:hypothetical protein
MSDRKRLIYISAIVVTLLAALVGLGAIRPANATSQEVFITDVGGVNVAAPALINVPSIPVIQQHQSPYVTAAGTPASMATTLAISLGAIQGSNGAGILDVNGVTIAITNGTNQNITAANLTFTQTVGGQTITITYNLNLSSIAASTGTFVQKVPTTEGVLMNAALNLTWGTSPTSGSVSCQAVFHTS